MAVKTAPPKNKQLIPPEESMWQRYSPHNEAPLAGATSLFLHGAIVGIMVVGGMAFFWAAREEAARPPKMDVVMLEGDGTGLEGGGAAPGLPGDPDAGAPKRTEQSGTLEKVSPSEPRVPNPPTNDKLPELGLPTFEIASPTLDKDLFLELERMAKDAADQANKEQAVPKSQPAPGPEGKKVGLKGTGDPKGQGGLGGSKGGPGAGDKTGAGIGKGGPKGRKATQQEIYAWRWHFNLGNSDKEHARMLATMGMTIAFPDPAGGLNDFLLVTDMNRRPVEFKKDSLAAYKDAVKWFNTKPESVQGLSRELELPFTPKFVIMLLPKEREKKMAEEEKRFAAQMRRDLRTVRKTFFDFRLQNGAYEPVGVRL
jgi:hypothetical protein